MTSLTDIIGAQITALSITSSRVTIELEDSITLDVVANPQNGGVEVRVAE